MNRELRNIESIRPRTEILAFLTMMDVIFLVLVTGIAFLFKGMAYPPLKDVFWIGTGLNVLFLLKPSKNNPGKSHLLMMILMLRRFLTGSYATVKSIDAREFSK